MKVKATTTVGEFVSGCQINLNLEEIYILASRADRIYQELKKNGDYCNLNDFKDEIKDISIFFQNLFGSHTMALEEAKKTLFTEIKAPSNTKEETKFYDENEFDK